MAQQGKGEDTEALKAELAALKDEVGRLAQALAGYVQAQGDHARETLKGKASDAAARAAGTAEELKALGLDAFSDVEKQAERLAGDLGAAIEKNPIGAVGVAFVAGLLIGLFRGR
jgi:ElaB/YqjD/DUF883 family membrane-anchored ribosome-binding protein